MRKIFLVLLLIVTLLPGFSQTSLLTIKVNGTVSTEGQVRIGIFDSENDFRSKTDPVFSSTVAPRDSIIVKTFEEIPIGIYAVAVYHDANNDEKLNTKKLGIPLEGVGFSGTNQKSFRPPKYEKASFEFIRDTTIAIYLKYPKNSNQ